jgi:hypothetical protein
MLGAYDTFSSMEGPMRRLSRNHDIIYPRKDRIYTSMAIKAPL